MLHKVVTSAAEGRGIRIEARLKNLELKVKSTHASALQTFTNFLGDIDELEVEVLKQSRSGSVTVLQRTNVLDLMEVAQGNGGMIEAYQSGFVNVIQAAIELSDYGALPLADSEAFEINFINFPVSAGYTFEIEVYSLDHAVDTTVHNVYEQIRFSASSPKEIEASAAKILAVPYAALDKVELIYRNGQRVQHVKNECIFKQRDAFVVRSVLTGTDGKASVNFANRMILIGIGDAYAFKLTTTADVNVLLLTQKSL